MAETLGGAVRHRRTEAGLTQQGLAKLAGISVRALRDIENGRVRRPHQSVVRRLATALGAAEDPVLAAAAGIVRDTVSARIAVLGPLAVHRGGLPVELASAMQRRLLGLLALRANETVSRDEVVDLLWDDGPPRTYLSALHSHAARLRRTLAPESASRTVLSVRGGYRLTVDASQLDSLRFLELDTAARASQAAGDSKSAAALLAEALGQWRGPVLADGPAGLRNHPVAVALSRRRLAVASSLADIAMEMGVPEQATENLQVLAADEPLHEGLHAKLMLTLAAAGEQSRALAVFAAIQARLADELGVLPGPEIQQAHLLILRQEVPTVAAPAIPAQATRPGVGWIAPAQLPLDVYGFSGRENELAALDALLAAGENQPTAVVISAIMGTAGVGKTALAVHWAHRVRHRFPDGQL
ncbi:MAG TPA: BTAD domain-containing putative transcriptional regulator, partial [Micromonosporaceae bacterium]|nr:BTAD domain-containing putative transcriptional regulator [Micromonosporaceae bacterium]